jgi:DUF1365 family protein
MDVLLASGAARQTLGRIMSWAMVSYAFNGVSIQFFAHDRQQDWRFAGIITPNGDLVSLQNTK